MTLLITGASGMIGSSLCRELNFQNQNYYTLSREASNLVKKQIHWDPDKYHIDAKSLKYVDTVVHLAGEPMGRRWSASIRKKIYSSRANGTQMLCATLAKNKIPLKDFICASGISFYGSSLKKTFRESSPQGKGFLADVVREWEEATYPLQDIGTRIVKMRFAPVLSPNGGMLAKLLPFFKFGLGGNLGSSNQHMSWIALEDAIRAIIFFLEKKDLEGVFNVVSPHTVTNAEFTAILGWILKRPTLFHVPSFVLSIMFGEMAMETILASHKVVPQKLMDAGFEFKYPELESALKACL